MGDKSWLNVGVWVHCGLETAEVRALRRQSSSTHFWGSSWGTGFIHAKMLPQQLNQHDKDPALISSSLWRLNRPSEGCGTQAMLLYQSP